MTTSPMHAAVQAAAKAPRMGLATITRQSTRRGLRVLLYGVEGVGKTTFAAGAPSPVFLGPEDGYGTLDVARFPQPETWGDVLEAVRTLTREPHGFGALVLDTLDWLEGKVWGHICKRDGKPNVEAYGYGKGYVAAADEWLVLLSALEGLQRQHPGLHVVLLAHATIRPFKNPTGDDYDRFNLKLHEKSAGKLKEWADAVLFANHQSAVVKLNDRAKGLGGPGSRVVHTERRDAWDAKNRHGLPEQLPLAWSDFAAAVEAGGLSADTLRAEITAGIEQLPADQRPAAREWLTKTANTTDLRVGLNKLRTRLAALTTTT